MHRIAKGNPPRMEFLQRGLQLIDNWSHCDLIHFKAGGDIGFCCSTGLRRDGDGFRLSLLVSKHVQEITPGSLDSRGNDLLSAIHANHSQGKRHGGAGPFHLGQPMMVWKQKELRGVRLPKKAWGED